PPPLPEQPPIPSSADATPAEAPRNGTLPFRPLLTPDNPSRTSATRLAARPPEKPPYAPIQPPSAAADRATPPDRPTPSRKRSLGALGGDLPRWKRNASVFAVVVVLGAPFVLTPAKGSAQNTVDAPPPPTAAPPPPAPAEKEGLALELPPTERPPAA